MAAYRNFAKFIKLCSVDNKEILMFSWFDASEAKKFAQSLAEFVMERISPEDEVRGKKAETKRRELLEKIVIRVRQFKAQNTLNVYKKAQLGNTFKWVLLEAKYDRQFVDELTDLIIKQL
jgi:hypothetical protein